MKESDILNNEEMVDILISTPGRLVELIKDHPSIDLHNLQYLVVDEADKLLLQSFDNWIHVVRSFLFLSFSYTVIWTKRPIPSSRTQIRAISSRVPATTRPFPVSRFRIPAGLARFFCRRR